METTARGSTPSSSGVSNSTEGTLNKAASSAHAAVDSIAGAADQAARKAKPAIDQVAAMAHQAVEKAAGAAAPTAEWLTEQGESLNATQKKLFSDTCSYVSANPLKAVGIAVVAGFLLSRIILK
jgi:ElaB protein